MPTLNQLGKELQGQYPEYADKDPVDLARRAKAKYPEKYAAYQGTEPPGWVKTGINLLPTAGGIGGGIIGGAAATAPTFGLATGPAAVEGAALGSMGGEAARQLLNRAFGLEAPQTPQEAGHAISTQGALGAVGEGGGRVLAAGAKAVAKPVMELALKATPEVAQTAIREGIAATTKGLRTTMERIGQSAQEASHYVQQATRQGQRYDGVQFARNVMAKVWPTATDRPIPRPMQRRILQLTQRFLGQNPTAVTPARLHVMKQAADDLAAPIYRRMETMNPPNARETMEANWYKAFADHAREVLNETIPDYQTVNGRTESLIKLKDAVWPTTKKQLTIGAQVAGEAMRRTPGAVLGGLAGAEYPGNRGQHALIGAGLGALAGTPSALSSTALAAYSPALQALLQYLPRLLTTPASVAAP